MNKNKFSVIITSYNSEDYIEEAIESVLEQDFKDYELIIVDDCSTDKTMERIEKYKRSNIKIYKTNKNTGTAGGTRNLGIEHSEGEYILFLDGDDKLYNKDILTKINDLIANGTYDMVFLGYQDLGNLNKIRMYDESSVKKESRINCDITFSVSSKCWNRKFINDNNLRFVEGLYYEDEVFCMKANILSEKYIYGDFPIFWYRRNRKGSVMTTPSIKKCSDWYRVLAELIDMLEITQEEYKPYLLSFIENEKENISNKNIAILKALTKKNNIPIFPKREYTFVDIWDKLINNKE